MYNRLNELSNWDGYSFCEDSNNADFYGQGLEKGPLRETTAGGEDNIIEEEPFYYRSQDISTDNYEISFQNNFMDEHKNVFKTELKKLQEFMEQSIQKYVTQKNFHNELFQGKWEEVATQEKDCLTTEQISKLQKEEKINQFLNNVCSNCNLSIASGLIKVAHQVLDQFNKVRKEDPACCDLLDIAEKLSKDIKCNGLHPSTFDISLGRETRELFSKYDTFMNIYCSTVMLVLALYFENPFNKGSSNDGPKRPLAPFCLEESSEDQIFEAAPQKKRKFSF